MKTARQLELAWVVTAPLAAILAAPLAAIVLPPGSAAAQDLYSMRAVTWETIPGSKTAVPVGVDQAGAIYEDLKSIDETKTPFACYHPSDPDGTAAKPEVDQGGYRVAMTQDLSAIAAFRYCPGPVQLYHCQCAGGGTCEKKWEYATTLPNLGEHETDKWPGRLVMSPDGVPCFVTFQGLLCAVPNPGKTAVEWMLRIDFSWLDANLPMDPGQAWHATAPGLTQADMKSQWDLLSVTWHPDGRMFALVAVQYYTTEANSDWIPLVIEQHDDGTAEVVMRPPRPPVPGEMWFYGDIHTVPYNPIQYATQLFYEPTLDALVAWPSALMEFNHTPMWDPKWGEYAAGSGGEGLYVIPMKGGDTGYLSLLHGRVDGMGRAPLPDALGFPLPGGGIGFPVPKVEAGLLHRLVLDLDWLDMDCDGLPYSQEKELGTSDYTIESDWGTTFDSVEIAALGTDPTSSSDDPSPLMNERIVYVESGLIWGYFDRLGLTEQVKSSLVFGTSGVGPLCLQVDDERIECIQEADRTSRISFPHKDEHSLRFSADGTFALVGTEQGLLRVMLDTGHAEPVLDWGTVLQACNAEVLEDISIDFFPATRTLTFVTCGRLISEGDKAWDEFYALAFQGSDPGKVIYDHQKARCDSGLGPCDPSLDEWKAVKDGTPGKLFPHDLLFNGVKAAGYVPEIDRLVLNVAGSWGRYYVGLSPDHDPAVLVGPKYLQGGMNVDYMAERFQPTGYGDYYTSFGIMDGWLNPHPDAWLQFGNPPAMFWGGLAVGTAGDGWMWEYVRYDGLGEPGDVLLLAQAKLGSMIYRSGPRGGLAHAWIEPYPFYSPDTPWGMEVGANGLLCIAHRKGLYNSGAVSVLEGYAPFDVPSGSLVEVGDLGDVTDCHWGDDGSLYWLNADPPRIERLPQMWVEESEVVQELPEESEPVDLVIRPDGTFEYLDANGALRGLYYLSDGRRLEVPMSDFIVRIDGEPSVNLNPIIFAEYGVPVADAAHTFIRFQERADGLVVVVPFGSKAPPPMGGTAFVFDPDTDEMWQLSTIPLNPATGNGLAIMPGGVDVDPWEQASGAGGEPEGPEGPAPVEAPTYGYPMTRDAGGCSTGSALGARGGWGGLFCLGLGLLLLAALRVRQAALGNGCLVVLVVALLVSGCGGGGTGDGGTEPGGDDPGEGPTNEESLMPLEPGTRFVIQKGETRSHVVVTSGEAPDSRREEWSDGSVVEWVKTSQGWALAGDNNGKIDPPLLMVPDQVRVGMAWSSGPFQFKVLSRSLQRTPWGERMTWAIHAVGTSGPVVSYYVEGRGWWKNAGLDDRVIASFRALDATDGEGPQGPKVTLEPLRGADGQQLVLGMESNPVLAVEDEPGTMAVGLKGVGWAFLDGVWILVGKRACLRFADDGFQTLTTTKADGDFAKEGNAICLGPDAPDAYNEELSHYSIAPWMSPDGADYFYLNYSENPRKEFGYLVAGEDDKLPTFLTYHLGFVREASWGNTAFDLMAELPYTNDPQEALVHFDYEAGVAFAPMRPQGGTFPLGVFTRSGVLLRSEWVQGKEVTQPVPIGYAGFGALVQVSRSGRTAMLAHPGWADEVRWVDGQAQFERLASYTLGENHFVTGAFRQGANLIVTTGNRVEGADLSNGLDARKTWFWRVKAQQGTGVEVAPPPSLAVGAAVSGVDVVVCWPPNDEPLNPEGWKLGGAPVLKVGLAWEQGNCALAVRDLERALDIWLDGGGLLEADIPGVGPMEIVVPPASTAFREDALTNINYAPHEVWNLADGGLAGMGKWYDSQGLPLGTGPTGLDGWFGTQDGAGNGFWHSNGARVELISGRGEVVESDKEWPNPNGAGYPAHKILGTAATGGCIVVAVQGGKGESWLVETDGSLEPLPEKLDYSASSAAISSQGLLCADIGTTGLSCFDEEGNTKQVSLEEPVSGPMTVRPFGDGKILATAIYSGTSWTLDPATAKATPYGDGLPLQGNFSYGPDSTLYVVPTHDNQPARGGGYTGNFGPDSIPYELTPEGPVEMPLPPFGGHAGFQEDIWAFIPAAEYSFVVFANGQFIRVVP